jgi:hypothetical protein
MCLNHVGVTTVEAGPWFSPSFNEASGNRHVLASVWTSDLLHLSQALYQRAIATAYIVCYPEPLLGCPSECGCYTWINTGSAHRKKRFTSFPSPAGMSLTKLPMGRNNPVMTSLFPPRESLVVTSRLETGNSRTFFLRCKLECRLVGNSL